MTMSRFWQAIPTKQMTSPACLGSPQCAQRVDMAELAVSVVAVQDRLAGLTGEPLVAPTDHDHQQVDELGALLGQDVLEPWPPVVDKG